MADEYTREDGVYEMLWDCEFCTTTKLLGKTHKFCPNCGAPQKPENRYFPSDEEKVAVKDHVFVGADKVCPSCGTLLPADIEFCTRCGAPQTEAAAVKLQGSRERGLQESFTQEDLDAREVEEFRIATGQATAEGDKKSGGIKPWQIGLGVVILGVIGFALFAIFATRSVDTYVTGFRWERSIQVQELRAVTGKVAQGSEPFGAYDVSCRREQTGSRQVPDGEDCRMRQVDQGDGTFRQEQVCTTRYRSEPVYGMMCSYSVNEWVNAREIDAGGDKSQALTWPLTQLNNTGGCASCLSSTSMACLRCEREGNRGEQYFLVLKGEGDTPYECPVPLDQWESTAMETAFTVNVGRVGGGARCDSLEPAQ